MNSLQFSRKWCFISMFRGMLYKMILAFQSVDEIHRNVSSKISCAALRFLFSWEKYFSISDEFRVLSSKLFVNVELNF